MRNFYVYPLQQGQTVSKALGQNRSKFDYFGYTDLFGFINPSRLDEMLIRADESGANVLRFPIDWCGAAHGNGMDPDDWQWDPRLIAAFHCRMRP